MKRLSTILVLLCVVNSLFAQRTKKNAAQSFLSIDISVPIYNTTFAKLPIPLAIEWQRKKKRFGFGISIALEYDKNSRGDCSKRIPIGTYLYEAASPPGTLRWYCVTYQTLGVKPSVFGSYYLLENKQWRLWTKLGAIAEKKVLVHQEGEAYEVEIKTGAGTTIQVIKSEPIHINRNIEPYKGIKWGLLSGLGANYALNKRTALRFTIQSELYSDYFEDNNRNGALLFASLGVTTKM
jgi:hypothetical protein